jgi:GT2 family glycosyltransferase
MAIVEITPQRAATPFAAAEPELSVVIVTWNSQRWIERCLRSIPAACDGLAYEVVVYDNASQDRTLQLLGGDVRLIASQRNDGFAGAINRALGTARGPFVLLLNPDCQLGPRSLTQLVDFLHQHPNVSAAAPLLEDESGESQREFQIRRFPTLMTFIFDVLAIDKLWPSNPVTASRFRDLDLTQPRRVDQPAAAALLVRREVFDDIGAFDAQFSPAWFEDVDYCKRLAQAGREIWIVPPAQAQHFGGASLEHVPFARFVDVWYGNMWRYAKKWFTPVQAEALRWFIMLGMILRIPAALIGIAHREVGRMGAFAAYMGVLKRAFERWDDASPSS